MQYNGCQKKLLEVEGAEGQKFQTKAQVEYKLYNTSILIQARGLGIQIL